VEPVVHCYIMTSQLAYVSGESVVAYTRIHRGCRAGRNECRAINGQTVGNSVMSSDQLTSDVQLDSLVDQSESEIPLTYSKQSTWLLPSIFLANVRSMFNKLDDLEMVLHTNNVDIARISPTWLSDEVPSEAVSIDRYNLFRNDRNRHRGGIGCFAKRFSV